ncbi:MAG TPA: hypothetical protein VI172_04135 [Candidatus Dormibacteraeota bacterium]|jgi:hypothetical protein
MTTEIFEGMTGRNISNYDLLDETTEKYGVDRAEAHEAITAMLQGIVEADGQDVILDRQPVRPHLLDSNPGDVDVNHWLTVSDETANEIREALASVYAA